MKYFYFNILFFSFCFIPIFAQSVKITPKKVEYTRPNVTSSFKKTFTITYPIVSGIKPSLAKKIQESISYEKVLSLDIKEEINNSNWLLEAEYEVGYNRRGVLSVYLNYTGLGAYEQYFGKNVVVDLKTGKRVTAKDVFRNLNSLLAKIKKLQKEEIAEAIKEIKEQKDFSDVETETLFEYVDFKKNNLEDFSVDEKGVWFQYDYGFPRLYMMIEPTGNYFLSWKAIKPFINSKGLFKRFIKSL